MPISTSPPSLNEKSSGETKTHLTPVAEASAIPDETSVVVPIRSEMPLHIEISDEEKVDPNRVPNSNSVQPGDEIEFQIENVKGVFVQTKGMRRVDIYENGDAPLVGFVGLTRDELVTVLGKRGSAAMINVVAFVPLAEERREGIEELIVKIEQEEAEMKQTDTEEDSSEQAVVIPMHA
jgi:hypothetical protein